MCFLIIGSILVLRFANFVSVESRGTLICMLEVGSLESAETDNLIEGLGVGRDNGSFQVS